MASKYKSNIIQLSHTERHLNRLLIGCTGVLQAAAVLQSHGVTEGAPEVIEIGSHIKLAKVKLTDGKFAHIMRTVHQGVIIYIEQE